MKQFPVVQKRDWLLVALIFLFAISICSTGAAEARLVIRDQFDRPVTLNRRPQRIVSGLPGNTEILCPGWRNGGGSDGLVRLSAGGKE